MSRVKSSKFKIRVWCFVFALFTIHFSLFSANAQNFEKDFPIKSGGFVDVTNLFGKIRIEADETIEDKIYLVVRSSKSLTEKDFTIKASEGKIHLEVNQQSAKTRIDLLVRVPQRLRVKAETEEGEVAIDGDFQSAEVLTDTGTISTNIPLENLKYSFWWTESRPRFLSDVQLEEVKEKSAGRFTISGKLVNSNSETQRLKDAENRVEDEVSTPETESKNPKSKVKKPISNQISLNFSTARGIVLLNVSPTEVSSDLRERPLTEAARSIVRSGDSMLAEAIRRASPKYFGDYLKTLPPRRITPTLNDKPKDASYSTAKVKRVVARVMDVNNRAVSGLEKKDFTLTEKGIEREILSVEKVTAPFNLVLLLDVSGSIENYVSFIRKAARNFLNTMSPQDKISIIIFSEDVKQLTVFTTNRNQLSESLDTFDAGGGTAYYDAIGFTLVDVLKPFRGERTGIVILSDGDDNRSFLPFESLLGSIQESGALIYPLYVPTALAAASASNNADDSLDPLRTRYMGLTSKAEAEGARLAQVSGGVYYPIRRIDELQKAYEDIVVQLRTAYTITYRSESTEVGDSASPRLRVKVNREGAFVNLGAVTIVPTAETSELRDYMKEGSPPDFEPLKIEEITGEIREISYKATLGSKLPIISLEGFNVNKSPPAFALDNLAISRWVSPKRTRSYPYERIYNTLTSSKKSTIIPIIKDEGINGERDFVQFDTFSLMNLLDVYLILGYYNDAQRDDANELTDQKFDNQFILKQINDLKSFSGTATEWNLKQISDISSIAELAKTAYSEISKRTGVRLHDEKGIENFVVKITKSFEEFRLLSRQKSQKAQNREFVTLQPKEALSGDDSKARVTITDKSGGKYFLTCDETLVEEKTLTLMEAKHTIRAKLPSQSDIKDGLIKMILYTNLKNVKVGAESVKLKVALRLTSNKLKGSTKSDAKIEELEKFYTANSLNKRQIEFLTKLFNEAKTNNFQIVLENAETAK